MTSISLLPGAQHVRRVIDDCEWRLKTFVERDAYVAYDCWISGQRLPNDVVTREHLRAINQAMMAHAREEPWQRFFDQRLPELEAIPEDLDLILSADAEVEAGLRALAQLTRRITDQPWVTDMAVSKILHLIRPRCIAISDSYVRLCLGVADADVPGPLHSAAFCAARLDRVQRGVRDLGLANRESLERLHQYAGTIPPLIPAHGVLRGQALPIRLSRVRMLDILMWTDVAINGHTPHVRWRAWYEKEIGKPVELGGPHARTAAVGQGRERVVAAPRLTPDSVAGAEVFVDADNRYLQWLDEHSDGLVVNCERHPRPAYLRLHRASCKTIGGTPARGLAWTSAYIKICALRREPLDTWARLTVGRPLDSCGLCRP